MVATKQASAAAPSLVPRKVNEVRCERGRTVLLYCESGVGKTTCLAALGRIGPTLVIDCDGGQESLAGLPGSENVEVVEARRISDFDRLYSQLASGELQYKCVAIDTATEFEKLACLDLAGVRGKEFVELKEYGDAAQKMREYFRKFKDLSSRGVHVVITAHERVDPVKEGVGMLVNKAFPAFTKGFSREVGRLVDICAYLVSDRDGQRSFMLDAGNREYFAKVRGHSGLGDQEPADLADLIAKSFGQEAGAKEKK